MILFTDSGEAMLEKVPGLEGNRIMDIAAGAEHSVIVTGSNFSSVSLSFEIDILMVSYSCFPPVSL